ncbi:MAG: M48 family metallopeptidase [Patescibacteria group bacterium]
MKKEIIVNGQKIEYAIKKYKNNKNLRLAINSSGHLVASKPWYLTEKTLKNFILKNSQWIIEKMSQWQKIKETNPFRSNQKEYSTYKKQAERLIIKKVNDFNQAYQFKFSKITIRNQKTRWGSCSSRGNLNFNYKLVFLPERMINYIIVHELCHLRELNHSPRFWSLVAQNIPNYKIIQKDLQKKGIELR